jgi:hypothetical protein
MEPKGCVFRRQSVYFRLSTGTGNGHLLFELLELSPPFAHPSHMLGVDYSLPSIDLCKRIAQSKGEEARQVDFQVVDIINECARLQTLRWDLVCDKGTVSGINKAFTESILIYYRFVV